MSPLIMEAPIRQLAPVEELGGPVTEPATSDVVLPERAPQRLAAT